MNNDPLDIRMRELLWRRNLTTAEQAELREWLARHPDEQVDWDAEVELSAILGKLPDSPLPSNFTARVLQAAERDSTGTAHTAIRRTLWWWRVIVPRVAITGIVLAVGWVVYQEQQEAQVRKLAESVKAVTSVASLPEPQVLEDLDNIQKLATSPGPDKELLKDMVAWMQ